MRKIYLLFFVLLSMTWSVSAQKIALVTNKADVTALPSEQHIHDALVNWGYEVTVVEDDDVGNEVADFSGVDAIVISEVASSSKLVKIHTYYKFPKPVVNLKGFMMRYDKWGWTINPDTEMYPDKGDYPTFKEDRDGCGMGTQDMEILTADHYITQDFTAGAAITWSTAPCNLAKTPFAYGYDLQQVSGAIALTKNMSVNMPEGYNSIYAIPAGAEIKGAVDTMTTENRIVVIGAHNFALANEEGDDDPPGKSYMTEDFLKLFQRSVEWALYGDDGPSTGGPKIALVTNKADVSALPSEQHIYDALTGWGYDVKVIEDDDVGNEVADFSGVDAIVISEVASSSKLVKIHTYYKFPKPVVNLKGFMMRYDKWGWTINPDTEMYPDKGDYPTFKEDRDGCGMGTQDMEILTADHYITQDFTAGAAITWSTAPCNLAKTPFAYGYDLQQVSGAIALTKNMSVNMPEGYNSIYAIPAGSEIQGAVDTMTTENRIVIIGAHNFALANEEGDDDPPGKSYMTEDFLKLFERSVEWALYGDAGPPSGGPKVALVTNKADVTALPSEQHIYNTLVEWGYEVKVIEDDEVGNEVADFSGVDAIVISEVASSSKLVKIHTYYKFPKPVVNLKGFMMRYDKWGWTINPDTEMYPDKGDYPTFKEDRDGCGMGTQDMEILTADHYITQDFTTGQGITWSTAPCNLAKTPFAYGYDLQQVSGAIALTKNMSVNMPEGYNSIYAIPAGSEIKGAVDTMTTENRIVIIGAHNFALANEEGDDDPPGKSYMTEDFLKLFERSMEWAIYGDAGKPSKETIALVTNKSDVSALPSEQHIYDALTSWGYGVKVIEDDEVGNEVADFSDVDAIVISEVASSSKLVKLHTVYKFPKPVVNLKGFMMRYDKWGWTINPDTEMYPDKGDYPTFKEDRDGCGMGTQDMEILRADHYITQDFTAGAAITWSTAPCNLAKTPFAYGYDLQQVSGAIALTKNMSVNMPEGYNSIYAVPTGSEIKGAVDTMTTENRIVIIGAHNFALANEEGDDDPPGKSYMTDDFLTLFQRSVEWALGAADLPVDAPLVIKNEENQVVLYPNPAKDYAKVRFTVTDMQEVSLSLYNMVGQKIEVSTPQMFFNGEHEIDINTRELNEGLYIYVLTIGNDLHKGKLNIVK